MKNALVAFSETMKEIKQSVFDTQSKRSHHEQKCFVDDSVTLARYDSVAHPQFEKLTKQQMSYFWTPEEVDIFRDAKDFKDLTPHEQHIFTSNLKRQILLDSVQGRAPVVALLPIVSVPELENWIITWSFFETIHSRSYTHLIQNIYPNPSVVFDEINNIKEIIDCAVDISKYYDDLIEYSSYYNLFGPGDITITDATGNTKQIKITKYELKKRLWLALMSINALEGIRFYVSFACSWAFAEQGKRMEGNAKIIKFIARDENLHLASTQQLIKILPREDNDFKRIASSTEKECIKIYQSAVDQEKEWAKYLFKDGSMVGLNEQMLGDYVEWIAGKRMRAIGLPTEYKAGANPLPWTQRWIAGSDVQVAPQEVELSSYTTGSVKRDVNKETFKGFSL